VEVGVTLIFILVTSLSLLVESLYSGRIGHQITRYDGVFLNMLKLWHVRSRLIWCV